jgi:PAS domain S-box-containing protein
MKYEPVGDEVFLEGVDPIFIKDLEGRILDVNPAAERVYGWSRDELLGKDIEAVMPGARQADLQRLIERVKSGHDVVDVPVLRRTKEGEVLAVLLSVSLLRDEDGRPTAVATVAKDGRYDFLFSSAPVPLWEEDWSKVKERTRALREGGVEDLGAHFRVRPAELRACLGSARLLRSNQAARELLDSDGELVGCLGAWVEEGSLPALADRLGELARGAKSVRGTVAVRTLRGARKDVVLHLQLNPANPEALRSVLISLVDVTAVRMAERAVLEERAEMRTLLDTLGDGVISIDTRGRIESINQAAERIFGYRAEEVLGSNVSMLMPPEHAEAHDEFIRRYVEGGEAKIIGIGRELLGRRKDGALFPIELGVGDSSDDRRQRFTGIVRDLTERKALELEFLQAQKLEAVGRLAGGIAHDFNNLLTGLLVGCRLLAKQVDPGSSSSELLVELQREALRGVGLTRQLLDFSRGGDHEIKTIDLNVVLSESQSLLQRLLGEDVALTIQLPLIGGRVAANRGQLDQILMNLVVNSRDAMPQGGAFTIALSEREYAAQEHRGLEPGRHVLLSVTDTGIGMDQETRQRAFDPFFTTKPEGKGTGLGLSTVFGLVQTFGGHIELHSEPQHGTTVSIYLPAVADDGLKEPTAARGICAPGRGSILVVEDEPLVRKGLQLLLEGQGYDLLVAQDPRVALELLQESRNVIDLLLTDMVMPHMTGAELAQRARALRPGLPVLFTSAFSAEALIEQGRLAPGDRLLEKPFTEECLSQMVAEALASRPC